MEINAAKRLVRETFEKPFDKERFYKLTQNIFKHLDVSNPYQTAGSRIPNAGAFMPYINSIERSGKYHDGHNRIDVLIVNLKKADSLERARTMQRNFVAQYLDGFMGGELKDAALVAFVPPEPTDWRFSLVKMDYSLTQTAKGKTAAKKELTPARRWSFLVGQNESSHTAQSRLINILRDDSRLPSLLDIEEAFNVEVVTQEFFEKYAALFIDTKNAIDEILKNSDSVRTEFNAKRLNSDAFAKKLLGQIVFLYFLQKKGWFGVARDKAWGTGPGDFLRLLFQKNIVNYNNFFNDILEPLFFEALAKDRSDNDDFYRLFNSKIPFLNGGLFDPINSYDWVHIDIRLPDSLFSNDIKTKEGDTGTGILDVFDRYNFTVKEDEPLEKGRC